jgi:hypothetical protein
MQCVQCMLYATFFTFHMLRVEGNAHSTHPPEELPRHHIVLYVTADMDAWDVTEGLRGELSQGLGQALSQVCLYLCQSEAPHVMCLDDLFGDVDLRMPVYVCVCVCVCVCMCGCVDVCMCACVDVWMSCQLTAGVTSYTVPVLTRSRSA